jgi:hypothetical protein
MEYLHVYILNICMYDLTCLRERFTDSSNPRCRHHYLGLEFLRYILVWQRRTVWFGNDMITRLQRITITIPECLAWVAKPVLLAFVVGLIGPVKAKQLVSNIQMNSYQCLLMCYL